MRLYPKHIGIGRRGLAAGATLLLAFASARAQAPLPVYTDYLVNGFQDWGWAPHDYANTSPVHSGSKSVAVTMTSGYQGLQIYHPDLNSSLYSSISLWLNGGASGGQKLQVYGLLHVGTANNVGQGQYFSLGTLPTNTWQQFIVPLSALGVANRTNFTGFVIQDRIGTAQPTFYVDDIQLVAAPAPAPVHLSLNATQAVRVGGCALVRGEHRHLGQQFRHARHHFAAPGDGHAIAARPRRLALGRIPLEHRHQSHQHLAVGDLVCQFRPRRHQCRRAGTHHGQLRHGQHQ